MSRHRLHHDNPKLVRDRLNETVKLADEILRLESELIDHLISIARHRYFVRFGYRTLRGFCTHGLKFSRIQAQRIVTKVHRRQWDLEEDVEL